MKVSLNWLSDWVPIEQDVQQLRHLLTMAGLEVDDVAGAGAPLDNVVVGEVVSCARHPNADKLSVCEVSDGGDDLITVVCGAPNVAAGQRVAYAKPGTTLPNGVKLKIAKLRGVESHGMLCSAAELELGEGADGIIELPGDAPVGTALNEFLSLDDQIFDIDLTPNRGDCLSVTGIARELAALTGQNSKPIVVPVVPALNESVIPVRLEAPEACARYAGRVITGVDAARPTPIWLSEALRRAGVRSISPIVDITNYVMLELGQPMHAFDLDKIDSEIRVRYAQSGESLQLLDGQVVELNIETLVIADKSKPIALGGIMGGEQSSVQSTTTDILLESAYFDPIRLAGAARQFKLHTDASHRFERGVDFTGQERAIERATALVLEICGGKPGPVVCPESKQHLPERTPIAFRPGRVLDVLGIEVDPERAAEIFKRLGCAVDAAGEVWQVIPPSFRFDLSIEVDLIEEIARVHGYENLAVTMPQATMTVGDSDKTRESVAGIRSLLIDNGYYESITYSFVDEKLFELFSPERTPYRLENPISSDMSVMRGSLWPGLIAAMQYNQNRQHNDIRLFEVGRVFEVDPDGLSQPLRIAGLAAGARLPEQWGGSNESIDFYDIKQIIKKLLSELRLGIAQEIIDPDPVLHPGKSVAFESAGGRVGQVGALHPRLAQELGLRVSPILFEVHLDDDLNGSIPAFQPLSKFPSVRRDLSIVVDAELPAGQVVAAGREAAGTLLRDLQLFDVFRGQGIDSDKKSLTLGLIFQAPSRTLTEDEIETSIQRVLSRLSDDFGGTLRE